MFDRILNAPLELGHFHGSLWILKLYLSIMLDYTILLRRRSEDSVTIKYKEYCTFLFFNTLVIACIQNIVEVLSLSEISSSLNIDCQDALVRCIRAIVNKTGINHSIISCSLFKILLTLLSITEDPDINLEVRFLFSTSFHKIPYQVKNSASIKSIQKGGDHSVHWGINPPSPSKTPPPSFSSSLPLSLNLPFVQAPLLGNSPYILLVFCDPPKNRIFQ